MPTVPAILALADGTVFRGEAIGATGHTVGEVVFNTSMTGYQEILTDPSYTKQIVTLTYPHIGNVGANPEDSESRAVFASGLIIRDLPLTHSNFRATSSLSDYLREMARGFGSMAGQDLAQVVSCREPYPWTTREWRLGEGYTEQREPRYHVVAYDFGVKHNILRMLAERGCKLTVVPAKTPARDVLALNPHGVFLSNGPGDPEPCTYAIDAISELMAARVPLFGICLGHQLLGLAAGGKTSKMKFGHHGANHPVQDLDSGRVMITSQNHGFQVDEASLPANVRVTHRSLFDGTVQGIALTDRPAFSFQGHPEASPGPHDVAYLFDRFIAAMEAQG